MALCLRSNGDATVEQQLGGAVRPPPPCWAFHPPHVNVWPQVDTETAIALGRVCNSIIRRHRDAIRAWRLCIACTYWQTLGCTTTELFSHFNARFQPGMTWTNFGQWHVDHVFPIVRASTDDEMVRCLSLKNLQPLWAANNMRKGAK